MRSIVYAFLVLFCAAAGAGEVVGQGNPTDVGLVAYYPFDGNFADATGATNNGGIASGLPEYACGVIGSSVALNGGNDFIRIPGGNTNNINREFNSEDFTLSLYFKSIGTNGTQYLVSKRDTNCNNLQYFTVRYHSQRRLLATPRCGPRRESPPGIPQCPRGRGIRNGQPRQRRKRR